MEDWGTQASFLWNEHLHNTYEMQFSQRVDILVVCFVHHNVVSIQQNISFFLVTNVRLPLICYQLHLAKKLGKQARNVGANWNIAP